MIKELERLLSYSYDPNGSTAFSAIVRMKDSKIFGGVMVKNNIFRSTIFAEEAAIAAAVSRGYRKGDFESIYILTSSKNINDLKNLNKNMICEFLDVDAVCYLYDLNRNERIIKVGNLIENIY